MTGSREYLREKILQLYNDWIRLAWPGDPPEQEDLDRFLDLIRDTVCEDNEWNPLGQPTYVSPEHRALLFPDGPTS